MGIEDTFPQLWNQSWLVFNGKMSKRTAAIEFHTIKSCRKKNFAEKCSSDMHQHFRYSLKVYKVTNG